MRTPLLGNPGFGISSVMVAAGLLSVLSLGVAEFMSNQNKSIQGIRTVSNRDHLKALLDRYSGDPIALRKSADTTPPAPFPANTTFKNCVSVTGTPCVIGADQPLALMDPNGNVIAGPGGASPVPQRYDLNGAPCGPTANPDTCPIEATATFSSYCPASGPCPPAARVEVKYVLRQSPGTTIKAGPALRTIAGDAVSSNLPLPASGSSPLTGSGTQDFLPRWAAGSQLTNSAIYQDPATDKIGIGNSSPTASVDILHPGPDGFPAKSVLKARANGEPFIKFEGSSDNLDLNPTIVMYRTRGTIGAEAPVQVGDQIIGVSSDVLTPTGRQWIAGIETYVEGDPYGARIEFRTNPPATIGLVPTTRMVITSSGNVGIGDAFTTPSSKLHVKGNVRIEGSSVTCTLGDGSAGGTCTSDLRLKKNVEVIDRALEKVLSLRGVTYEWKDESKNSGKGQIGVIAQDVQKAFPQAVSAQADSGVLQVDYAALTAPLIEAVKSLNRKIATLEEQVAELKNQNAELKERQKTR